MACPLVSFCVKCYNQQDLIRESLGCAFAQTYRPLEIVVSDDCSTDNSWAVIDKMVSDYKAKGGDIPIIVYHCEKNLGNLGNWQKCCELAHGELLVKMDGDDVSMPDRTEKVVEAWLKADKRPLIVYHGAYKMDQAGHRFGLMKKSVIDCGPGGAMSAYSRRLYDEFGPIVTRNRYAGDDSVYGGRATILGGDLLWIPDPLVFVRFGAGFATGVTGYRKFMSYGMRARLAANEQLLQDLENCKAPLAPEIKNEHRVRLQDESRFLASQFKLWQGATFADRLAAFRVLKPTIHGLPQQIIHRLLLLGCLSDPLFDGIKIAKYCLDRLCFQSE